MSDLSTAASMMQIARGLPVARFGFFLIKKENKTEEEARAAKAFKNFFISTIIVVLVAVIAVSVATVFGFSSNDGKLYETKRYGTVEGDSVWYIKNTKQYLSLEEFGLNEYNLQDGDKVILFFNSPADELIDAMPKDIYQANEDKGFSVMLITMAVTVVVLVAVVLISRKTIGKDFYEFYDRCLKGEIVVQQ